MSLGFVVYSNKTDDTNGRPGSRLRIIGDVLNVLERTKLAPSKYRIVDISKRNKVLAGNGRFFQYLLRAVLILVNTVKSQ